MKRSLVLLLGLVVGLLGCGDDPAPEAPEQASPDTTVEAAPPVVDAPSTGPRVAPTFEVRKSEVFEPCPNVEEVCARLLIEYPEFLTAANAQVLQKLNTTVLETLLAPSFSEGPAPSIEALQESFFEEYNGTLLEGFESRWFDERVVQVTHQEAGVLTLEFRHDSFYAAAHPNYAKVFQVIDITTGRQLTLDDLLIEGWEERLESLGEAAFRKVHNLSSTALLAAHGFYFENQTFDLTDNFAVVPEGLFFFYNPYDVAPWAFGSTEFTITWDEFGDLVLAGGPLGALEN